MLCNLLLFIETYFDVNVYCFKKSQQAETVLSGLVRLLLLL